MSCEVYWGSHGCDLNKGHAGHHECTCCGCENHEANNEIEDGVFCVGAYPYYGAETQFYGKDAPIIKEEKEN